MKKIVLGTLIAASAMMAANYAPCAGCHGAKAEKKALGKSQIIKGWDEAKIVAALKGYKAGTYGGPMKGLMKGQVAKYSDADLDAFSHTVGK